MNLIGNYIRTLQHYYIKYMPYVYYSCFDYYWETYLKYSVLPYNKSEEITLNNKLEKHYDIVFLCVKNFMILNRFLPDCPKDILFHINILYYQLYKIKKIKRLDNGNHIITMNDNSQYIGLSNIRF